jgi:hypothetical protein
MTGPLFNFLVRQEQNYSLQGMKMLEPSERAVFSYLPLMMGFMSDLFASWRPCTRKVDQVP